MRLNDVPKLKHTNSNNFFLLCGPCAIEGEDMALRIAEKVVKITDSLQIPYVFKGSFKKANRSRIDSFTGIGDEKALNITLNNDRASGDWNKPKLDSLLKDIQSDSKLFDSLDLSDIEIDDIEETFEKGANIYIKKPSSFSELKKSLKQVVKMNWAYHLNDFKKENFLLKI